VQQQESVHQLAGRCTSHAVLHEWWVNLHELRQNC
jgi:hypothetical protein